MYSKIKILGHPIHPMLVAYPIAFYTATLGAYIIYHFSGDAFWFKAAVAANLAGLISAAIAAVPGVLDWWLGIPGTSPAKRHGLIHMLLNLSAIPFVIVNSIIHTDKWDHPSQAGWGIALA